MNKELEFIRKAVVKACNPDWDWETIEKKGIKYIGQPITLARVLIALNLTSNSYLDTAGHLYKDIAIGAIDIESLKKEKGSYADVKLEYICKCNLIKDLCDQEPKTILSIAKLLGYEK